MNAKQTRKIYNKNTKEDSKLQKKFDTCFTRKCSKHLKKYKTETKSFVKEQDKQCPQKSAKEFYDCSSTFYEDSKLKKLFEHVVSCRSKKCSREMKKLQTFRKKRLEFGKQHPEYVNSIWNNVIKKAKPFDKYV